MSRRTRPRRGRSSVLQLRHLWHRPSRICRRSVVTPVEPHPLTGATNPQILGHEFSGDVVATGPDVTSVRDGDRVAIMPLAYCGTCAYCRRGLQHLCATMACVGLSHRWGGMGEIATVAEYQIVRLPDAVTYEQGALIEPTAVAAYGVERAGVGPGDRVLVTGAGPIGALAALARGQQERPRSTCPSRIRLGALVQRRLTSRSFSIPLGRCPRLSTRAQRRPRR